MKPRFLLLPMAAVLLAVLFLCLRVHSTPKALYTITDLGIRNDSDGYPCGLNDAGQVVAYSEATPSWKELPFLLSKGTKKPLTDPRLDSRVFGLNAYGMAVGYVNIKVRQRHACRFEDGKNRDLGTLGGKTSIAYAVNTSGQIVGVSMTSAPHCRAFLYSNGSMQDLGTLGGMGSEARSINDHNQIVGTAMNAEGCNRAFLSENGVMQDLGTLGGEQSFGRAVNESGQAAGFADTAVGTTRAFRYSLGRVQDLGTLPQGMVSFGYGINAHGEVVGSAETGMNDEYHAFLYKDEKMQDLNRLIPLRSGWVLTEARTINAQGQIAGYGSLNGKSHAFLLTLN